MNEDNVQAMTEHLRSGLVAKTPAVMLEGTVEIDEVYAVLCSNHHQVKGWLYGRGSDRDPRDRYGHMGKRQIRT